MRGWSSEGSPTHCADHARCPIVGEAVCRASKCPRGRSRRDHASGGAGVVGPDRSGKRGGVTRGHATSGLVSPKCARGRCDGDSGLAEAIPRPGGITVSGVRPGTAQPLAAIHPLDGCPPRTRTGGGLCPGSLWLGFRELRREERAAAHRQGLAILPTVFAALGDGDGWVCQDLGAILGHIRALFQSFDTHIP